jgi:hypothetical protein
MLWHLVFLRLRQSPSNRFFGVWQFLGSGLNIFVPSTLKNVFGFLNIVIAFDEPFPMS